MAAESSLPLRMMPTWRHMRSRICASAALTAGVATAWSGGAETAAGDFVECDAGEATAAADTADFAECVVAERDALAAVNFAECATAERDEADEFADELADEFECVTDAVWAEVLSCECESGLGAGLPGRVDALNLTGCAPF